MSLESKKMSDKEKMLTEDDVLDFILQTLYAHLHQNEMHLEKDILAPSGLQMDEKQVEHIRELLMTTHLVNNAVGFGKTGYVYLNKHGIAMMKRYKSYHAILAAEHRENNDQDNNRGGIYQPTDRPSAHTASEEPPVQGGDDMAH